MIIKGNKLTEKVPLKFHKSFVNIIYYRLFLQDSYLQLKNKIFEVLWIFWYVGLSNICYIDAR